MGLYLWQNANTDFWHPYENTDPASADPDFPADGNVVVTSDGTRFTVRGEGSGRTKVYTAP